jgi:hypothetical protein
MTDRLTLAELAELERILGPSLRLTAACSMARELLELESAIRWRESNRFRSDLQGRPVAEFLADSRVIGWKGLAP